MILLSIEIYSHFKINLLKDSKLISYKQFFLYYLIFLSKEFVSKR